jgi:hypothetical protein
LPRFKVLLPLQFLFHRACPPPECVMADPVALSWDGSENTLGVNASSTENFECPEALSAY